MLSKLLFVLLFLLSFFVFPFGVSQFETGKVLLGELLIFLIVILSLQQQGVEWRRLYQIPVIFLSILFFLSLIQLLVNGHELLFFGNAFRMQGIFLLWMLLLLAFFSSSIKLPKVSETIIVVLLFLQLLAAMFLNVTADGRGVGTMGEPNSLAAYAVFLWPFLFLSSFGNDRKKLLLKIIGTGLAILIIIFSGSRSGMIALGIEIVFVFFVSVIKWNILKSFFIAFCLFLLALLLPFFQTETIYENRAEIWQTAVYAGYEHPLIGWGFGNTETAFKEYNEKLYNRLRDYYVDSSHNIFLDWWVQGGFIGLACFIVLVYYSIRIFIREKKQLLLCLLFGLLTVMSFNPVSVVILIMFWWVIGGAMGNTKDVSEGERH